MRWFTLLLIGFVSVQAAGAVINVPGDQPTIQAAINFAVNGDEIIVAPGIYPEVINFNGKAIYLHSASGNPADTIIDGTGFGNSVVLCISGEGAGTILEGFTITGGTGNPFFGFHLLGGGMFNNLSTPTVTNCTFRANSAAFGGGMFNSSCSPAVTNCTFIGNSATLYDGGGMFNSLVDSDPTVTNCTFSLNSAGNRGGGMFNHRGSPTVTDCIFSGNSATNDGGGMSNTTNLSASIVTNCTFSGNSAGRGGGMFNAGSIPTVTNCTFRVNSAENGGGGIFNGGLSNVKVTNCTFSGNSTTNGGGGIHNISSGLNITNCILWGDGAEEIFFSGYSPSASFSDIQGGLPAGMIDGGGNIDLDPLFIDPIGADNIPGTNDDDLHLSPGSPCIDSGDNTTPRLAGITTDLDGNPRFIDDSGVLDTGNGIAPIVDMGAYEWQAVCPADISGTGDGIVNVGDLLNLLALWGPFRASCPADINGDGNVNVTDLLLLLAAWGACP